MGFPAFVIEHGETARDVRGLVHGPAHAEEPLDAAGRRQAAGLGARLREMARQGRGSSTLYASPARRARQTARIAGAIAHLPVATAEELRSLDTCGLTGGGEKAVARRLKPYFADPAKPLPGGESVAAWRTRHLGFMRRVAAEALRRGERPPAFVTHSNVVGSALAAAKGQPVDAARQAMAHPPAPAQPMRILIPGAAGRSK